MTQTLDDSPINLDGIVMNLFGVGLSRFGVREAGPNCEFFNGIAVDKSRFWLLIDYQQKVIRGKLSGVENREIKRSFFDLPGLTSSKGH